MKKMFIMSLTFGILYAQNGITINGIDSVERGMVQGSGIMVEKTVKLQAFKKIKTDVTLNLIVQKSNKYEYIIKADDNLLGIIKLKREGDTLIVRSTKSYQTNHEITLLINVKELALLQVEGSSTIELKRLNENQLELDIDGSIDVLASSGTVQNLNIKLDGAYDVDLSHLDVKNTNVNMKGSGDLQLNVSNHIDATVNDNGYLLYSGTPTIKKNISDNGQIEKK